MRYAQAYQVCEDIEIVGLAHPVEEHRKALVARASLSKSIPEFDDWRDMLNANGDLDGVVICTPNFLHSDQAVACLERGVPIALEKHLETTKRDCERTNGRGASGFRTALHPVLLEDS